MKHLYFLIILGLLAMPLCAQVNGDIQYIGDQAILQVWGNHYERGYAQGFLLGGSILDIFQYYCSLISYNYGEYNYLWNYFQEHFDTDTRMQSEAQGMISGMQAAGIELYHAGLQRNLGVEDILLINAIVDMVDLMGVDKASSGKDLGLGCASLSSWGISTQQDSLLAGSSVITRFLDWSYYSNALADNPLLVVHHPSESDEQKWMSFSYPGLIGPFSAINEAQTWASLNLGYNYTANNYQGLDPALFDLRRGIERLDYNSDGSSDAMDLVSSIGDGLHLFGEIIHTLSENSAGLISVVIETNNICTVTRYYDSFTSSPYGNLPGNNLAATNHFRLLTNPTGCTRYAHIQDSLNVDHNVSAERQWRVLSGAAGMSINLAAIQFIPSTGQILWAARTTNALPAYLVPAITLSAPDLFNYSVANQDEYLPAVAHSVSLYPNPLPQHAYLNLKSSLPFSSLELYNLRGQKVFSDRTHVSKTEARLELPELPIGIYLLRVKGTHDRSATRKLLISN